MLVVGKTFFILNLNFVSTKISHKAIIFMTYILHNMYVELKV